MKKLFFTLSASLACVVSMSQDFNRTYSQPREMEIGAGLINSLWECRLRGDEICIPAANYNFANDYVHLVAFDSVSYTIDSWQYMKDGVIVTGEGAPLDIIIRGWHKQGDIRMRQQTGIGALNGYYNGIELSTLNVHGTILKNMKFKYVAYADAIQGHDAADGIDTYILTGNTLTLPCHMKADLRQLIDKAREIRFDIRRMHDPKNFCLAELINFCDFSRKTIRIVGGPIYNEYLGKNVKLIYEDNFEPAPKPEPKPFMAEGEDFFVAEGFWADSITYTRKLSVNADSTKNMSSMILPFDIDAETLEAMDATPYTVSSVTATSTKTRKLTGTIPANTPFVIKRLGNPKNTDFTLTVRDVYVPATPDNLQSGYLVGVYKLQEIPVGCKIVKNGMFSAVIENGVMSTAFRAFVTSEPDNFYSSAPSRAATGINEPDIESEEETGCSMFDLNGQELTSPVHGQLYIMGMKKCIMK